MPYPMLARRPQRRPLFTRPSIERHSTVIPIAHAVRMLRWEGHMESITPQTALTRIQIEFAEMPDMKLSHAQIQRLCNLPPEVCDAALASLVESGFLWRRGDGSFLRRDLGRHMDAFYGPRSLRMAL